MAGMEMGLICKTSKGTRLRVLLAAAMMHRRIPADF
jgi:hypothetical protein